MSNLQKFNNTLEEFDKEVGKLKSVSEAYQKLEQLIESYNKIIDKLFQYDKALDKINGFNEGVHQKISSGLSELEKANKKGIDELSKLIDEKTGQLRKENKDFYKELDDTIKIKLDNNKSQIKQLIENERIRIKEIFEMEFAKNTKELRQTIEYELSKQTKVLLDNQKVIKISIWILSGITMILSALTVFRLLAS